MSPAVSRTPRRIPAAARLVLVVFAAYLTPPWMSAASCQGEVLKQAKISQTQGGFGGSLDDGDLFGRSVALLGDLDGDGVGDLAVGSDLDDDGGVNRGSVWILFLRTDGTVRGQQKISQTQGGFGGSLHDGDIFGFSVAALGDLDGDGVGDLAVGAVWDDDGGPQRGAVWILFLRADGTVRGQQKISQTQGGFGGSLDDGDLFGRSAASLGDLDGDGIGDLAAGADLDDDGGVDRGAVWILFLRADGTVSGQQKISQTQGGFGGALDDGDFFGIAAAGLGDLDGDGVPDIAAGAFGDDDGGSDRGAVWILFLCDTFQNYGVGLAGSGGILPRLGGQGCAAAGSTVSLNVTQGLGGAQGVLLVGLSQASIPALGGTVLVTPLGAPLPNPLGGAPGVAGAGSATFPLVLPAQPGLAGIELYWQGLQLDPGAPSGVSMTEGLRLTVR